MAKIKILHIIKSLGRGGAEVLLPETLGIHDTNKFEFHYLYFLPWKDQMVSAIEANGGVVSCMGAKNNLQILAKLNEVVDYCGTHGIALIHSHLPWSGFLARSVHFKTKIPVVYTEHNIQDRYHFATRTLNKFTFNYQSLALGVSRDVTESIMENIGPHIPVQTLLNGVNTSRFIKDKGLARDIRNKHGIPRGAVVVGNIAVFRKQKNLGLWIRSFQKIAKEHDHVFGMLVGAGPEEEVLQELVRELGLKERLVFPGLQTDTIPYFSAMDIFMMSSDFEGLPIALLEAMSMECAIVSTNAGGVKEVVRHKKDGLICGTGDMECLVRSVDFLIEDEETRMRLQTAARERIDREFSLSTMVNQLESCYLKIVDNKIM
jgi:glycosyltransferase involved in cell wall biosynthesis